jgi:tight adherence protein C
VSWLPPPFDAWLYAQFGELAPMVLVGGAGLLLILSSLPFLLKRKPDPFSKLKADASLTRREDPTKQTLRQASSGDKLERYSTFLEPQDEQEMSAARLRLRQAGYRGRNSVRMYHFAQFALGVGLLIAGGIFAMVKDATGDPSMQELLLTTLLPAVAGYMAPKYWVTRRRASRMEEIENGFPDALDMMLVCVEAGQSMDQSIIRVSQEIRAGYPALAEEFEIVSYELKAGKDKPSVFRDLAERAGVADVASFTTVLIQSQTFGTSIADALRVYAAEMRDKRVMKAEEKANKLPTKMTLATMMLTVPPLLIILLAPSIYDISQTLNGN